MTGLVLAGTVRSSPDRAAHGERQGVGTEGAESVEKTGASFHQGLPGGRELLGEVILTPHRYHRDISCTTQGLSADAGELRGRGGWGTFGLQGSYLELEPRGRARERESRQRGSVRT